MKAAKRKSRDVGGDPSVINLVERLYDDVAEESVVVFVGAGSTTERFKRGPGFYDSIKAKACYPESLPSPSFPELMEFFCRELDGGHHNRLIREAISYLELFSLPGEQNNIATMASDLLAEIPYLNRFVTTNWDPLIERSLDVLVPIVEDRDLAFWDDKKRQVLKIHGCITRPYSIVATQGDYQTCIGKSPLIFNKLKDLMATKTFLFMGYSMRDSTFQEVWNVITSALGSFAKLAYALDPNATQEGIDFWKERGIHLVKGYDIAFLRGLRNKLESEGIIPSQSFLVALDRQRRKILSIHLKLSQDSEGGMASSMYQDGLLHALTDVLSSTSLGIKQIQDFESDFTNAGKAVSAERNAGDPIETAYWSGRLEVLKHFCNREKTVIPPYFHPQKLCPVSKFVQGRKW